MSGVDRQQTAESPEKPAPEFETDSVEDLAELLRRAANWAERDCRAETIAEELRDGHEFVENEVL